ncbi:monodehydroascorbate reductase, partial [Tanacetum coccineum]
MRDKPYISKAERKKLKKGQTQGEVGDAGEVKENVAEKKKVKVGDQRCSELKVEGWGKTAVNEKEKLTDVDYVTGIPLSNDTLMYAVPVCAPYTALQSYEYRVKIIPGTTKKGKVPKVKMDDPNITMEEYIRLEEEKARRHGKVYNWETATYDKIWYDEDVHDLRCVETEFPAIVFNDSLTSEVTLPCEPMVSYFNDFDFLKDFEKEFQAIAYNDALTSKLDFLTEPTMSPQHIDEFDLKNETSLSECNEEEQNVLNFNDLFPFNVIYLYDLKLDKDNNDDKIDIKHSLGGNVLNTDDGAYAHRNHAAYPKDLAIRKLTICNYGVLDLYDVSKTLTNQCLALKNTPYPHQRYAVYNTLVNEEESTGFTSIRRIHQEDMAYPCLDREGIKSNTPYPEDINMPHSVSSSSHHQGTSSHQRDDDDDNDDVETSRACTPSPTTYLNSLGPLNYHNYQMPSAFEQTDETLFERQTTLLNQTQQMHKEM